MVYNYHIRRLSDNPHLGVQGPQKVFVRVLQGPTKTVVEEESESEEEEIIVVKKAKKKQPKKVKLYEDGLMEREDKKILTEDGRELLI